MLTEEEINKIVDDPNVSALEFKEILKREIIKDVFQLAKSGVKGDEVKLKARLKLLDKIMPDQSSVDLNLRSQAPYEQLLNELKNGQG